MVDPRPCVTVLVDAANCVGSVPDGWWRDRVGATERLRDSIAPDDLRHALQLDATPEVVLVVEGRARGVESCDAVQVVEVLPQREGTSLNVC